MRTRRERIGLWVLGGLLVVALVVLVLRVRQDDAGKPSTASVTRPRSGLKRPVLSDELKPFLERLGPPHYSSHNEELFIRDFFSDQRDGFFVDIGAGHFRDRSNTYFLENELGWSGIAIDPLPDLAADYLAYRPKTKFFAMFVSDASDHRAILYVGENRLFSSAQSDFTDGYTNVETTLEVPTIKLDDLLDAEGVRRIDFVSLDVELHEPKVLAGFDIRRFLPRLVCVEAHPQARQQILDYFAERRYVVIARYLRADRQNLWFMPLPG
ncbi:MAG: FkbM family methyltransferase [Candidatus Aminicenantales bacterium]